MHLVQSLGLPHLLMLAGALLVIAGCLGLAISRKKAAEIDDEPVHEPSPEPHPQRLDKFRLRHTNHSKVAMQRTAKTAKPPIMVNISSSQLDIEHPPYTRPVARQCRPFSPQTD
jgi:hypothetical protein